MTDPRTIKAVKSISLTYTASQELTGLFEDFGLMCNDAIRIALEMRPRNKFQLIEFAYNRLKEYGLHTHYILSACEVAYSAYKNKTRKVAPRLRRRFLKITRQSYLLSHLILRIPAMPSHFIYLTLNASDYHLALIDNPNLKMGEITITEKAVSIPFVKETTRIEPRGYLGIDVNEKNVTWSDSSRAFELRSTADIVEIKERYKEARARIGRHLARDNRVSKKLYAKYGRRERNRSVQVLHRISKQIVRQADQAKLGIAMEKLGGMQRLYRKGNGQGASFRGRMNAWLFHEIQRQVEYKAAWVGLPVFFVNPRGTSRKCPDCGSRVAPLQERRLYCQRCDKTWDRDVLASMNIVACAVPQGRPSKGSVEGEPRKQEDAGNPLSRWMEVKLVGCDQPSE